MNVEEKYSLLIGHSEIEEKRLYSMQQVAEYISGCGLYSDLIITQADGTFLLNTNGLFVDKVADADYGEELMKVLNPMLREILVTDEIDSSYGDYEESYDHGMEM